LIYRILKKEDIHTVDKLLDAFCDELDLEIGTSDFLRETIKSKEHRSFIAENGSIRGISGYLIQGEQAVGNFIYVIPSNRGGVIGGRLYHEMEKDAKEQGCKKIKILVTPQRAGLYLGSGFKVSHYLIEKEV